MFRPKPSAPHPRKKWRPDADSEAIISSPSGSSHSADIPDTSDPIEPNKWRAEVAVGSDEAFSSAEELGSFAKQGIPPKEELPREELPSEELPSEELLAERAEVVTVAPVAAPAVATAQSSQQKPAKTRLKRRLGRRAAAQKLPPPPTVISADAHQQAQELLRPTPVRWGWVFLPTFLVVAAASWFALPIRAVTVEGQRHLSAQQVVSAAGIGTDFGWLYYGAKRAAGLTNEPWVASATVTRQFPDRVHIAVTERTPYAVWQRPAEYGGDIAVVRDGTPLPDAPVSTNAAASLPAIEGWGPNRVRDALTVLEALRPYNVQLVKFTPSGLTAYSAEGGAAWSGDLESLLKHANAISEYPNEQLYIYPWGVSVQQ